MFIRCVNGKCQVRQIKDLIMHSDLKPHEQQILDKHFPDCKKSEGRGDIIFVYGDEFKEDIYETANTLQAAADFLKYVTCLNPAQFFNARIMVGHSKKYDQPNWSGKEGNRICIPWKPKYLKQDTFLKACSHELVHPFYRLSPLHTSNEKWGDPFCEFLRGQCKNVMGQEGKIWWLKNIEEYNKTRNSWRNVAGQILNYAKEISSNIGIKNFDIEEFLDDKEAMKIFMNHLFKEYRTKSLCNIFTPVGKMKLKTVI